MSKPTVLVLAPSNGLGGGIERYVSTITAAFETHAIPYHRMNLLTPKTPAGRMNRIAFIRDVRQIVSASQIPLRLVLAHRNLLPTIRFVGNLPAYTGTTVILHGSEVWSGRCIRGTRMMRRPDVRVVCASSFTAGAAAHAFPSGVLAPGLSKEWYDDLVRAAEEPKPRKSRLDVITVLRLSDWEGKGVRTLVDSIRLLDDSRVQLTVCGSGTPPAELINFIDSYDWCHLAANLSDCELALRLARSDLFALATRTHGGPEASGEGFGLVLLEAQIAGVPVIAPAHGGSHDAYQPSLTGLAPIDESPASLASVLSEVLYNDGLRASMGRSAADWARRRFEPRAYADHVVRQLLGQSPDLPKAGYSVTDLIHTDHQGFSCAASAG